MTEMLKNREERIKILIELGYKGNIETGKLYNKRGKEVTTKSKMGYLIIGTTISKICFNIKQHQFIYYLATGKVVDQIDHINGIKDDNRIINLRPVTKNENQWNQTKSKNYCWRKDLQKWQGYIQVNNKLIHLGYYNTTEEARQSYLDAKEKYHII